MSVLLTYLVIEGILVFVVNQQKIKEHELLRRWICGELSYSEIQALSYHKKFFLKKLNKSAKIGKHPGLFKKDD